MYEVWEVLGLGCVGKSTSLIAHLCCVSCAVRKSPDKNISGINALCCCLPGGRFGFADR